MLIDDLDNILPLLRHDIINACAAGDLETLKTYKMLYQEEISKGFIASCMHQHFHVADYLSENFEITRYKTSFIYCANAGVLEAVKYLLPHIEIRGDEEDREMFSYVCQKGRVEIAQFFLSQSKLNPLCDTAIGFYHACVNGHLLLAKYLFSHFSDSLEKENLKITLRQVCREHLVDVAQFLVVECGADCTDIMSGVLPIRHEIKKWLKIMSERNALLTINAIKPGATFKV